MPGRSSAATVGASCFGGGGRLLGSERCLGDQIGCQLGDGPQPRSTSSVTSAELRSTGEEARRRGGWIDGSPWPAVSIEGRSSASVSPSVIQPGSIGRGLGGQNHGSLTANVSVPASPAAVIEGARLRRAHGH